MRYIFICTILSTLLCEASFAQNNVDRQHIFIIKKDFLPLFGSLKISVGDATKICSLRHRDLSMYTNNSGFDDMELYVKGNKRHKLPIAKGQANVFILVAYNIGLGTVQMRQLQLGELKSLYQGKNWLQGKFHKMGYHSLKDIDPGL